MTEGARLSARLRQAIDEVASQFDGVSEERTARRRAPTQWSAREIVGHLIDSACNNQRRFIVNQQADRLSVEPYDQERWVALSHHGDTPVSHLLPTLRAYNQQVARIIERISDDVLWRPRGPIREYSFGYLAYPTSEFATLRDLIEDYVGHIHHHLDQLRRVLRAS